MGLVDFIKRASDYTNNSPLVSDPLVLAFNTSRVEHWKTVLNYNKPGEVRSGVSFLCLY